MMDIFKKIRGRRSEKAVRERCLRYAIEAGAKNIDAVILAKSMKAFIDEGKTDLPGYGRYSTS